MRKFLWQHRMCWMGGMQGRIMQVDCAERPFWIFVCTRFNFKEAMEMSPVQGVLFRNSSASLAKQWSSARRQNFIVNANWIRQKLRLPLQRRLFPTSRLFNVLAPRGCLLSPLKLPPLPPWGSSGPLKPLDVAPRCRINRTVLGTCHFLVNC